MDPLEFCFFFYSTISLCDKNKTEIWLSHPLLTHYYTLMASCCSGEKDSNVDFVATSPCTLAVLPSSPASFPDPQVLLGLCCALRLSDLLLVPQMEGLCIRKQSSTWIALCSLSTPRGLCCALSISAQLLLTWRCLSGPPWLGSALSTLCPTKCNVLLRSPYQDWFAKLFVILWFRPVFPTRFPVTRVDATYLSISTPREQ